MYGGIYVHGSPTAYYAPAVQSPTAPTATSIEGDVWRWSCVTHASSWERLLPVPPKSWRWFDVFRQPMQIVLLAGPALVRQWRRILQHAAAAEERKRFVQRLRGTA